LRIGGILLSYHLVSDSALTGRRWYKAITTGFLAIFSGLCALGFWLLIPYSDYSVILFILCPAAAAGYLYGIRFGIFFALLYLSLAAGMAGARGILSLVSPAELITTSACTLTLSLVTAKINALRSSVRTEGQSFPAIKTLPILPASRDRELVQKVNSIILCMDLEGKITFFNEFAEKFFGFNREEVIGRNVIGSIVPESEKLVAELLRKVRSTNRIPGPYGYNENENITRSGKRIWIAWTNKVIADRRGKAVEILSVGLDISRRKQMEDKLRVLNTTLQSLNKSMIRDIQAAARIQKAILPSDSPQVKAIHFDWLFEPSEKLGGDTFNVFLLDEHHVGFYVLDVSGHGVAAALLSVTLNRLLYPFSDMSALLKRKTSTPPGYALNAPALVAERLNEQFPFDDILQQYFTLIYGIFDIRTLKVRYVSAGHPGLVYIPAAGGAQLLRAPGFPIGLSKKPGYEEQCLQLASGDRLYLYTDGLVERLDPRDECYGTERLTACLSDSRTLPLSDTLKILWRELEAWGSGRKAEDDLTLLAAEIREPA
jgi:PAS domain S-box-containing protein